MLPIMATLVISLIGPQTLDPAWLRGSGRRTLRTTSLKSLPRASFLPLLSMIRGLPLLPNSLESTTVR